MRMLITLCALVACTLSMAGVARADLWVNIHGMKVNTPSLPGQGCELMSDNGKVQTVRCGNSHPHQDRFFDMNYVSSGNAKLTCRFKFGRIYQWYTEVTNECSKLKVNENTYDLYKKY